MYNLDEQFSNLTTKQITKMVELRIKKESELSEMVTSLEIKQGNCSNDDRYDQLQGKIEKLETKMEDYAEWLNAAKALVSEPLWNKMVDNDQTWAY